MFPPSPLRFCAETNPELAYMLNAVTLAEKTPSVAPILPTLALPVTFNVPVIFAPVLVAIIILPVPPTETVTLPPEEAILTFEVPLEIFDPPAAVSPVN